MLLENKKKEPIIESYFFEVQNKKVVNLDYLDIKKVANLENYIEIKSEDVVNQFFTNTLILKDNLEIPKLISNLDELKNYFTISTDVESIKIINHNEILNKSLGMTKLEIMQVKNQLAFTNKMLGTEKINSMNKDKQIALLNKNLGMTKLEIMQIKNTIKSEVK